MVTADGRYYLKLGRHLRQVQADKERLEDDSAQAALAPADGAELVSRLKSASGRTITVSDPAPKTRGRWRVAYYDALHHGHLPDGHKLRWNGRRRGDCVFTLVAVFPRGLQALLSGAQRPRIPYSGSGALWPESWLLGRGCSQSPGAHQPGRGGPGQTTRCDYDGVGAGPKLGRRWFR